MHYRSAMVLGTLLGRSTGAEKLAALERITEHLLPGRWADARHPTSKELAATTVLALPLTECVGEGQRRAAGRRRRTTSSLPIWAGTVPLVETFGDAGRRPRTCVRPARARLRRGSGRAEHRSQLPPAVAVVGHAARPARRRPAAAPRHGRRRRRRDRRRRLHRALDRLLPAPRPTRRCGSSSWRRRPRASAPRAATAAGARRCSPRRGRRSPGRRRATRRSRMQRAHVRHGRRDRPRSSPPRASTCHWAKGGTRRHRAYPRPARPRPGGDRRGPRVGLRRRGLRAGSSPTRCASDVGATDVLGGDVHPALRRDPPGAAGRGASPRRSSGWACAIYEGTPALSARARRRAYAVRRSCAPRR